MTDLSRRKMLTAAAATAAGAITSAGLPAPAVADDAADLKLFVTLSAALTGIAESQLAPVVDPIAVRTDYFDQAKGDKKFPALIKTMRDNPTNPAAAAEKVMKNPDPDIMYLGRSIILAWYLGAWYAPEKLKHPPYPVDPDMIISSKAYTQGWTWRVAQAHPMGYSELRFGYWSDDPLPLDAYIKG